MTQNEKHLTPVTEFTQEMSTNSTKIGPSEISSSDLLALVNANDIFTSDWAITLDPPIQFSRYNGFGGAWYLATYVRNT